MIAVLVGSFACLGWSLFFADIHSDDENWSLSSVQPSRQNGLSEEPSQDHNTLANAPPNWLHHGQPAVFVDIAQADVSVTFDVAAEEASVEAHLLFNQPEEGRPVFDLNQEIRRAFVDGVEYPASVVERITDPDGLSPFLWLKKDLPRGQHSMRLEYTLRSQHGLTYHPEGVEFISYADDLEADHFLERYFPTNFEYDPYPMTLSVELTNSSARYHALTNGSIEASDGTKHQAGVLIEDGRFTVEFPSWYTTSSFFLHLFPVGRYLLQRDVFESLDGKRTPVLVYGKNADEVSTALGRAQKIVSELEGDFGSYPHDVLVAWIQDHISMEYCGATTSRLGDIGHELTHLWFGRGVMPASGNAGWIDEAMAQWRNDGYPSAKPLSHTPKPTRTAGHLATMSAYERKTHPNSYETGSSVLAQIDYVLKDQGGLKPVMRAWFNDYKTRTVTTPIWEKFVLDRTNGKEKKETIAEIFLEYVYGRSRRSTK